MVEVFTISHMTSQEYGKTSILN